MIDELFWRAEEACRLAWPAATECAVGDWVFRQAGGTTRRTNSANPIGSAARASAELIDQAASFYDGYGQALIFRVPSFLPGCEKALTARGFEASAHTATLLAQLPTEHRDTDGQVELFERPGGRWIAARQRVAPAGGAQKRVYREMLQRLKPPRCFASLSYEGAARSVAYGVIHRGLLVLESVATEPELRGRGFARRVVRSVMAWGAAAGASHACLQVMKDNAPALRVYGDLGFRRHLYDYSYYGRASVVP